MRPAEVFDVELHPCTPEDQERRLRKEREARDITKPVTGSKTARPRLAVVVHNITAIIGAGVLGLPYAMASLGWYGGVFVVVLFFVLSLYTLGQLVYLHHDDNGNRYNRYYELGERAWGKRGKWLVVVVQVIVLLATTIVYCVTGGTAMQRVFKFYCNTDACPAFGLSAWIMVFSGIQLIITPMLPKLTSILWLSSVAAIMSMVYCTFAMAMSISYGRQTDPATGELVGYSLDGQSTAAGIFNGCAALGTVAFAYGGHSVVLEIQAHLADEEDRGVTKVYMRGVYITYIAISWCYFTVAFAGYAAFGENVTRNILFSLEEPQWAVVVALLAVAIHMVGSYQLFSIVIFDMLEVALHGKTRRISSFTGRLVYRSIYNVLTGFIAVSLPFFGQLVNFFGAFGEGPATLILPSAFWLLIHRPNISHTSFWMSWFCIVTGVIVTVAGSVAGMRAIILTASGYQFYQ